MKIKLSKDIMFEPTIQSTRPYILGTLAIFIMCYIFNYELIWYIIAFIIETLMFLWFETTWYPYGIKPEDMEKVNR